MLLSKRLFCSKKILCNSVAYYSRKSNAKDLGSYKIVKSDDVIEDAVDSRFGASPNWELLAPRGYRFVLPGSLGPAWHEPGSMVPVDDFHKTSEKKTGFDFETLECTAQECPVLLRQGILELFPGTDVSSSQQMTVVSLCHKKKQKTKQGWKCKETETEYNTKTFMWAAQEICMKLKMGGYWADFINPFSGRPYLSPFYNSKLYQTDHRFRCLGFEIQANGNCRVIQSKPDSDFIGSLFTNAPASATFLLELLNED